MMVPLASWQRYSHIAVEEKDDIPVERTPSTIPKRTTRLLCFLCFGLFFSAGYVLRIAQTLRITSDIYRTLDIMCTDSSSESTDRSYSRSGSNHDRL